jgi:autotransporter-associated beta strand protein
VATLGVAWFLTFNPPAKQVASVAGSGKFRPLKTGRFLFGVALAAGLGLVRPAPAAESLASLGSNNFTVISQFTTAPYLQTSTNLTLNASYSPGDAVGGQFASVYDWSAFAGFGLFMSAPGESPNVQFTVRFYDPLQTLIRGYQGFASGLTTTSTFVPLTLSEVSSGSLGSVSYFEFTWDFFGSEPVVLHSVAGSPPPVLWSETSDGAWLTGTNWAGGVVPGAADVAEFGVNPVSGTTPVGIDMGSNGGAQNIGAIEVAPNRTAALTIDNSAVGAAGELILNGAFVNGTQNVILRNGSAQVLTLADGPTAALEVVLGNATDNVVVIDGAGGITVSSIVSGFDRQLTKAGSGAGRLTLSGANTFGGGVNLAAGTLRLASATAAGTGAITQSAGTTLEIDTTGTVTNAMSLYHVSTLQTVTLSGAKTLNNSTYTVTTGTTTTESGILSGSGGLTKEGAGTLLVTGSNSYEGATEVNAGVLQLAGTSGGAASSTASVAVGSGAILLIAQSNQVNNSAEVSLSGGTILRGAGVSEVFGLLTLYDDSFLDFGTGATGELRFGEYAPSALLTIYNFLPGNRLIFVGSDLSGSIDDSGLFSFQGGFESAWDEDTSTFTVTAIPEPSAWLAVGFLIMVVAWQTVGARWRGVRSAR